MWGASTFSRRRYVDACTLCAGASFLFKCAVCSSCCERVGIEMRQNTQGRSSQYSGDAICKLFVGNVNKNTTDEDFRSYFDKFGLLKDIILMRDGNNPNQNRGFGFVTPESPDITDRILLSRNHQLDGRDLDIKRALPKEIDDPLIHVRTQRIFLGGLPHNVTEEELTAFFNEKYGDLGAVKEIIIKKDRQSGRPRGFCFISFENEHVVDKMLIECRYPVINNKRCEIRKADPGVPISGVPPAHIQKYSSKSSSVPYASPRPQQPPVPVRSGGGRMVSQQSSMNSQTMHMNSISHSQNPVPQYGTQAPSGGGVPPLNSGNSYGYNNYGQNSGVVGYPHSSAYYNFYHNQPGMGTAYPSSGGSSQQQNQNCYPVQDNRQMKPNYIKSSSSLGIMPRGRPY